MGFRFEFDPAKKILLLRFEGRLTDESLAEYYRAARKYSTATDASVGIFDSSLVTGFAVSAKPSVRWQVRNLPCPMRSGVPDLLLPRPRLDLA